MEDRYEVVLKTLQDSYGTGFMVKACAEYVTKNYDNYAPAEEGSSRPDELALQLWNWFSGGDTAERTAEKLREALDVAV